MKEGTMRTISLLSRASIFGVLLMLGACGGSDEKTVIVQPQPQPQVQSQPTVVVPPAAGAVKVCPSGQTIC
jgi:hypothetical protein